MPRTLSGIKLSVKLSATLANLLNDAVSSSVGHPALSYDPSLTNGVDSNQANRAWQSTARSLASGAQETLDLFDFDAVDIGSGNGRDGVGQTMTLEEIVAIVIINNNVVTAVGSLEIVPAAGAGWSPIGSHTVATGGALRGQGLLLKTQPAEAGFDVNNEVNHRITLRANGGSLTYSLYILARDDDFISSSSSSSESSSSSSPSSSSASSVSSSSSSVSSSGKSSSSSSESGSSQSSSSSSISSSGKSSSSSSSSSQSSVSSSSPSSGSSSSSS